MSRLSEAIDYVRDLLLFCQEKGLDEAHASALRRKAFEPDPLRWALCYLAPHLTNSDGEITLSRIHESWLEDGEEWGSEDARDIYIAPRGTGKSTWLLTILPMWAAATGRIKFAVAFSNRAEQAEEHLATFRDEMEHNVLLRADYPGLVTPAKRKSGQLVSDKRSMLQTMSGFTYAARGADTASLGLKVGTQRPDLIILDDIEQGAGTSAYVMKQRLTRVLQDILPMGADRCRTIMVGTTTTSGSIMHQAVLHVKDPAQAQWVDDNQFAVHHSLPFDEAGNSIWPERWDTAWLHSIEHTASFAANFLCQPRADAGEYWTDDDYLTGDLASISKRIICIDPAVTTKRSSDETGISVVGYSAAARKAVVYEAFGVRLKGAPLKAKVLELLAKYPDTALILWEKNQGGDMLAESVLDGIPVRVQTVHSTEKKEIRMERALSYYRRGVVLHAHRLPTLEAQQMEFPQGLHDDVADTVSLALDHLAAPAAKAPLRTAVR